MIHTSLAAYPGWNILRATQAALKGSEEPQLGRCAARVLQLVPQTFGVYTLEILDQIKALHAGEIRLHANIQIGPRRVMADLSGFTRYRGYFKELGALNKHLGSPVYTAHAGRRSEADFRSMLRNAKALSDAWGCVVGVEGHYPTPNNTFLVDSWAEYRALFESGAPYVVDLSHLNIVAHASGVQELNMVCEAVSNPNCVEVHVSHNDGRSDSHEPLTEAPWWWPAMNRIHNKAVVFTEARATRTNR